MSKSAAFGCAFALTASSVATAATPAQLFARQSEYRDARMSPNGEYVAVITPFEDRRALSMIKLSGKYDRSLIKFDREELWNGHIIRLEPFNPEWTDDSRVMVDKAADYGFLGSLVSTGNIYAADANAGNQVQLFGYLPDRGNIRSRFKDEGNATLVRTLPGTKGEAIFSFRPWTTGNSKNTTVVYRVDTFSGQRKQVDTYPDYYEVTADNTGTVRFLTGEYLDGREFVSYRRMPSDGALGAVPATIAGERLNVRFFESDNNHVYADISDRGEPAALYRMDLAAGTREKIAGNANVEVGHVMRAGYEGNPFAVQFTASRPKIDYTDTKSEWAGLHSALMKLFPGQLVRFIDFTRDNNKLLFFVYSDRHPGAYYLFDRTTKTPQMLFETMEWIDPAKMSPTQPIEFKNRNGDTLYGFYTAPLGKQGALPLVVMPHGGPFMVSDEWGYDPDVQFLASLGYAVLQVNYRGSSMRGHHFEESAYKQWGTGIQDDITDGVKFVIGQKMADPAKVCIYGASFGGYSAMMNPIRNPGMYKCAIGYAGVYDLAKLYGVRDGSKQGRSFFTRTMGDAAVLAAQSPTSQVASLDVPMLLIHGKSDYVAPIEQFDAASAALSHAGKTFETFAVANEGHGFYKEENQVEAYKRMQAFLLKYNPPN